MVEPAPICFFKRPPMTVEEAKYKLSLYIDGYPPEEFAIISMEDIVPNKYFITSYGRVFTICGRELFPDYFVSNNNVIYMRIELSCTTYIKRRKFFIHRLVANAFIPFTEEDIMNNRLDVNHKYNRDGRCNYVWNLEWCNISENTLHALYFNEFFDPSLFDFSFITNRRDILVKQYSQIGEDNPKSKLSADQVELICFAHKVLGYTPFECAIYAWLDGNSQDMSMVYSILNGYAWQHISGRYGIEPKKRSKPKRANPRRENKKEEYDEMKNNKLQTFNDYRKGTIEEISIGVTE